MHRQEGGPGSTGSDFNMNLVGGPYETDMKFGNFNGAAFAENEFRISPRLTFTPGARVEFLHSTARGYTEDTVATPRSKNRTFVLFGAGAAFAATATTDIYANATQAYRPIEYSFLTPFASLTRIDPNLKDPKGYNLDLGWRGSVGDVLQFDVGVFDLVYNDRIGLISGVDSTGTPFTERTNVATSKHRGVESYLNLSLTSLLNAQPSFGTIDIYDALGYTHARYTDGEFARQHRRVCAGVVNRAGVTYGARARAGGRAVELRVEAVLRREQHRRELQRRHRHRSRVPDRRSLGEVAAHKTHRARLRREQPRQPLLLHDANDRVSGTGDHSRHWPQHYLGARAGF